MTVAPYVIMDSSESKPWFTKCCFCIPLRTASLIMVYLALVWATLVTTGAFGAFVWIFQETNGFDSVPTDDIPNTHNITPIVQRLILGHYAAILSFIILFHILSMTLTILCLVGIHKRRPHLIHWHISFTTSHMLVMITSLGYNYLLEAGILLIYVQLIGIGVTAYHLVVLYVYFGQLTREVENEKVNEKMNEKNSAVYKIPIM